MVNKNVYLFYLSDAVEKIDIQMFTIHFNLQLKK